MTQISFFYSTSPTEDTYNTKVFIYADNGSDSPGALLGSAYGPQISQNYAGSWVNVDISVPGLTSGSKYWLGWINDAPSGINTFFWGHSSGTGGIGKYKTVTDGYAQTPDPYGTPSGSTPNAYLIYGTYTPTGSSVVVTPSALNLASAILAPIISAQKQITILPNVLELNGALLAPGLKTGVRVMPGALALVSYLFMPLISTPAKKASLAMDAEVYDLNIKAIVEN